MTRRYSESDLQVLSGDAAAWIRTRPDRFFPNGRIDAILLLSYVMMDVIAIGRGECRAVQRDGWSIASSDVDWLAHSTRSIDELFEHIVSAPEHGDNSLRAEVLVNAFAADVAIYSPGGTRLIKGVAPSETMWPECRRAIAFRMPAHVA